MTDEELWLYTLCQKNNLIITDIQIRLLQLFKTHLLDWNKKINLVSRKNEERLWREHIALSLSLLFKIQFHSGMRVLDLGTGGGFPGIPLSIMLPECSFLLLDSTQKKISAVQSMIDHLPLPNAKTLWGRAEEIGKKNDYGFTFDAVVARSVSSLSNLIEWGAPFLKKQSGKNIIKEQRLFIATPSLITFKGMEIETEEKKAQRDFPSLRLQNVPLTFLGSEGFDNADKKLVIATFN